MDWQPDGIEIIKKGDISKVDREYFICKICGCEFMAPVSSCTMVNKKIAHTCPTCRSICLSNNVPGLGLKFKCTVCGSIFFKSKEKCRCLRALPGQKEKLFYDCPTCGCEVKCEID